jgi:hypothetical protein
VFDELLYGRQSVLQRFWYRTKVVGFFGAMFLLGWGTTAWAMMVAVGNVHAWWSHIPSMSFITAASIVLPSYLVILAWSVLSEWLKRS